MRSFLPAPQGLMGGGMTPRALLRGPPGLSSREGATVTTPFRCAHARQGRVLRAPRLVASLKDPPSQALTHLTGVKTHGHSYDHDSIGRQRIVEPQELPRV